MKKTILLFLYLLSLAILVPSCDDDDDDNNSGSTPTENILEILESNEDYSLLIQAIEKAGLNVSLINTTQDFTLFAPTNEAFGLIGVDSAVIDSINTDTLTALLSYHVLATEVKSDELTTGFVTTLADFGNGPLSLYINAGTLLLNGSVSLDTDNLDQEATNGVIHGINAVLSPLDLASAISVDGELSTLASLLTEFGLAFDEEDAPYTVFAPDDDAFDDVLSELEGLSGDTIVSILSNHLVVGENLRSSALTNGLEINVASGLTLTVNIDGDEITLEAEGLQDAEIIVKDIQTIDGVLHIIDEVITIEADGDNSSGNPDLDLYQVLQSDDDFSLLVLALEATGLNAIISDTTSEFTIFAPDNEAFENAGLADSTTIANTDATTLTNILLYHVLTTKVLSADLPADGTYLSTASPISFTEGDTLTASLLFNTAPLKLNGEVGIEDTNIEAKNGVIHEIEDVLEIPTIAAVIGFDDRLESLDDALDSAGIDLGTLTPPSTLFAPNTTAFGALGVNLDSVLSQLNTSNQLEEILLTHVITENNILSSDITNGQTVDAASTVPLTFGVSDGTVTVTTAAPSSAEVQVANIQTSDGVVHIVSGVLLPPGIGGL